MRRAEDAAQHEQATELMEKVRRVMPESWTADLDAKVDAHLKQFNETGAQPE